MWAMKDQYSPDCGSHFLHNSGQPSMLKSSGAMRWYMPLGRHNSRGNSTILSISRWVIVVSHSGSILRLWQFIINNVCKVSAAPRIHWGNVCCLGQCSRCRTFILNLWIALSQFNGRFSILQCLPYRTSSLGRRGKDSRLPRDWTSKTSREVSYARLNKTFKLSQYSKVKV